MHLTTLQRIELIVALSNVARNETDEHGRALLLRTIEALSVDMLDRQRRNAGDTGDNTAGT